MTTLDLVGRRSMTIRRHTLEKIGKKGTPCIVLICYDDAIPALPVHIWLTPKAADMAKRSFKIIGFDGPVKSLNMFPTLLAGNVVPVDVSLEEWQGEETLKGSIALGDISEKTYTELDELLGLTGKPMPEPPAAPAAETPKQVERDQHGAPDEDDFNEDDVPF